jgi:uncharacterized protein involved in response to NO
MQIEPSTPVKAPFLHLGFRPFFLAGIVGGAVLVALWMGIYVMGWDILPKRYPHITWHAHEMVYGYASAVITGFLLTAVKNWTGIQTIHHKPLLGLFIIWLLARFLVFIPGSWAFVSLAIVDSLFFLFAMIAYSYPVIKTRQWHQLAFSGKLLFLFVGNIVFYLGLAGIIKNGAHYGLYIGLYTVVATIFTMGRRIIPFFIAKGLDEPFEPTNYRWVDVSSLWLFLVFSAADIFTPDFPVLRWVTAFFAVVLLALHGARLKGWYHKGIWKKPLLWVLYIGYSWFVLAFVLKLLAIFAGVSAFLSVHAFAYGGIAIITLGMMARVTLGHTGRNVFDPPPILIPVFGLLVVGAVVRVILPLFFSNNYIYWVGLAQVLWIAAFLLLSFVYAPMLVKARIDGRYG